MGKVRMTAARGVVRVYWGEESGNVCGGEGGEKGGRTSLAVGRVVEGRGEGSHAGHDDTRGRRPGRGRTESKRGGRGSRAWAGVAVAGESLSRATRPLVSG